MHTNFDTMDPGCMNTTLQLLPDALHAPNPVADRGRAQFHKEAPHPKNNDCAASHDGSAAADSAAVLPRGRGYVIESRRGDDELNSITIAPSN